MATTGHITVRADDVKNIIDEYNSRTKGGGEAKGNINFKGSQHNNTANIKMDVICDNQQYKSSSNSAPITPVTSSRAAVHPQSRSTSRQALRASSKKPSRAPSKSKSKAPSIKPSKLTQLSRTPSRHKSKASTRQPSRHKSKASTGQPSRHLSKDPRESRHHIKSSSRSCGCSLPCSCSSGGILPASLTGSTSKTKSTGTVHSTTSSNVRSRSSSSYMRSSSSTHDSKKRKEVIPSMKALRIKRSSRSSSSTPRLKKRKVIPSIKAPSIGLKRNKSAPVSRTSHSLSPCSSCIRAEERGDQFCGTCSPKFMTKKRRSSQTPEITSSKKLRPSRASYGTSVCSPCSSCRRDEQAGGGRGCTCSPCTLRQTSKQRDNSKSSHRISSLRSGPSCFSCQSCQRDRDEEREGASGKPWCAPCSAGGQRKSRSISAASHKDSARTSGGVSCYSCKRENKASIAGGSRGVSCYSCERERKQSHGQKSKANSLKQLCACSPCCFGGWGSKPRASSAASRKSTHSSKHSSKIGPDSCSECTSDEWTCFKVSNCCASSSSKDEKQLSSSHSRKASNRYRLLPKASRYSIRRTQKTKTKGRRSSVCYPCSYSSLKSHKSSAARSSHKPSTAHSSHRASLGKKFVARKKTSFVRPDILIFQERPKKTKPVRHPARKRATKAKPRVSHTRYYQPDTASRKSSIKRTSTRSKPLSRSTECPESAMELRNRPGLCQRCLFWCCN